MKLVIGCDHAAFLYKEQLREYLVAQGHEVEDMGCHSLESVDYADYALPVAQRVAQGQAERGILLCYTGIGMSIAANKLEGIRCALCADPFSAKLTRAHNDSNVLAVGAGMLGYAMVEEIAEVWLTEPFEGGRHQCRIDKISAIERDTHNHP